MKDKFIKEIIWMKDQLVSKQQYASQGLQTEQERNIGVSSCRKVNSNGLSWVPLSLNIFWQRCVKMNVTAISNIAHRLGFPQATTFPKSFSSLFTYTVSAPVGHVDTVSFSRWNLSYPEEPFRNKQFQSPDNTRCSAQRLRLALHIWSREAIHFPKLCDKNSRRKIISITILIFTVFHYFSVISFKSFSWPIAGQSSEAIYDLLRKNSRVEAKGSCRIFVRVFLENVDLGTMKKRKRRVGMTQDLRDRNCGN
jgi:hypothetical protein